MSDPLDFVDDLCLFCGKPAKEKYFSGSYYQTYLNCECKPRQAYKETVSLVQKLGEPALKLKHKMELQKTLKEAESNVAHIKAQLKEKS